MQIQEPIIIVEDDTDDQEMILSILNELQVEHKIVFFDNGEKALSYLLKEDVVPFIIFSDINMPFLTGFQLRDKIHEHDGLRSKCVPFIFLTTGGNAKYVWQAYSKSAQGYFIKPYTVSEWKDFFSTTIKYWTKSKRPLQNM